jgi:hypothetical protein
MTNFWWCRVLEVNSSKREVIVWICPWCDIVDLTLPRTKVFFAMLLHDIFIEAYGGQLRANYKINGNGKDENDHTRTPEDVAADCNPCKDASIYIESVKLLWWSSGFRDKPKTAYDVDHVD